jgi:hypothetical protein
MKAKKKGKKKKLTVPTWITTAINGEALDVLRVWQLNDAAHAFPEVAILRALTAGAKTLAEDNAVLLKFLNDNDVFSKPVNVLIHRISVPPGPACSPPHWDFILVHGRASNAAVIHVTCFT